jgi:two-component system, NarL family, nitrate/nitrite response regulator NarL
MTLTPTPSAASPSLAAPIAVLVVDDQLAVREGLTRLISCAQIPLRCVYAAANVAEALRLVKLHVPEVVVLDVDLAGDDGLALITQLAPGVAVLVLTSHGDPTTRARARLLGAMAFVEKHQPAADLLGAIVRIAHLQMRGDKAPGARGPSSLPGLAASSVVEATRHH